MGANAQTSVPAFTAGQVLTAQQQTEINTGIPVFATTTTRDAAFGGTGEKTLAEGQFAYIEASNATQYYDGAAWQTVGGGLTLIKSQTIGTAVSSVTVSDVFSATYDNYLVTVTGGVGSTTSDINMIMGATATGYYNFLIYTAYNSNSINGESNNNTTNFRYFASSTTDTISGWAVIQNPFNAKITTMSTNAIRTQGTYHFLWFQGFLNNTTSYTAFTIAPGTGTLTGGIIRVYGYQNS